MRRAYAEATLGASNALAATPTGEVPDETGGPYPGDGSNGVDVLDDSGIVRHDIRRSFGDSRTLAKGVPLRVNLAVTDASDDYAPLSGLAVYLWHCDRSGRYSMYSPGVEDENYLRGIAATDGEGKAWFRTIFPACYSGRWPHIHFEVYSSVARAVANGPILKTVAGRAAAGGLPEGLRDQRIRGKPEQPRADLAVDRQRLQRRQGDPPARDRDRERRARIRREPHRRHLTRSDGRRGAPALRRPLLLASVSGAPRVARQSL